jgi:cytochrome oxidase Cu insertion factor (SCO1/SenC/PrrC family)
MIVSKSLLLIVLYVTLALLMRIRFRNRATAVLLVIVLTASSGWLIRDFRHEIRRAFSSANLLAATHLDWPPRLNETYPDLVLIDQEGREMRLSSLRGKVILLEPVGLSCPACLAFSGGHLFGPFRGVAPQPNLERIDTYLR